MDIINIIEQNRLYLDELVENKKIKSYKITSINLSLDNDGEIGVIITPMPVAISLACKSRYSIVDNLLKSQHYYREMKFSEINDYTHNFEQIGQNIDVDGN